VILDIPKQARHQAQTVTQLKDFVGKLGGLQNESLSLKLRKAFYILEDVDQCAQFDLQISVS
jgi:hypothetical protein